MSLYTGKGDAGDTSLFGGARISKSSLQVQAYGTIDEAIAQIAYATSQVSIDIVAASLRFLTGRLMMCASLVASTPSEAAELIQITHDDITTVESMTDDLSKEVGTLQGFVQFAGTSNIPASTGATSIDVARTVARRAERALVALFKQDPSSKEHLGLVLVFLNRASDALFACACKTMLDECGTLAYWKP